MSSFKKIVSTVILSIFICNIVPMTVLAENINKNYTEPQFSNYENKINKEESKIVKEDTEKRERNVKHFLKEDNTYEAVIYPYSVHYNNNGQWEDIDNTLIDSTDEDNNSILENKNNSYKVKFGKKVDSNKLVSIKKDKYEIYWNLVDESEISEDNVNNTNLPIEEQLESTEEATPDIEDTIESNAEKDIETNTEVIEAEEDVEINEDVEPQGESEIEDSTEIESSSNVEDSDKSTQDVDETSETDETTETTEVSQTKQKEEDSISENKVNLKYYNNLNKNSQLEVVDRNLDKLQELSENDKKRTLTKTESTVIFKDIYNNVDLSYNVEPDKFKETIIINEKTSNPEFRFNLYAKNLIAEINKDKSISFYDSEDKENVIFVIDAPFMYDSNGEESTDIEIKLEETKKGYELIITPSNEWLNSGDRVYPIYVDPTLTTSLDVNDIMDAHVSQNYAGTNYQVSSILKTGYGSSSGINRSYMSFELPTTLSSADMIIDAELCLWLNNDASTSRQVDAHKVTGSWSSSTITWNNKPAYSSKIEDYKLVQGVAGNYFSWDVTEIVKEWHSTGTNYGFMLKNHDESTGYTEYRSSDTTIAGARPQIVLSYVNNSGLESYWTYHSQSVGRAGTGFVNDYNGNLIFTHNDLSMNGNLMPVSINHVFNSNEKSTDIKYGFGWRTNLSQRIENQTIGGTNYYVYTDEDGTKHYLKLDSASGEIKDESGLNITLTINSASTDERYVLKDKEDNKLTFTSTGYLKKIYDNNGSYIQLNYSGTTLIEVIDGAKRKTTLTRNADGSLKEIIDQSNRKTTFTYTNSKLTYITYPDGKYSSYTYDANNNLSEAKNYDGYRITYSYYTVKPYRINKIQESNTNGTLGEQLDVTYGYNTTTFKDYRGKKNIYQFNDYGNTISIRDDEGYAQYYKYNESGFNKNKLTTQSKLQSSVLNYVQNHNAEVYSNWTVEPWAGSSGSGAYSTAYSYLGKQSLKINKTNTTSRHVYEQKLSLQKGKSYTLSSYVKTENISSGKGAVISVYYKDRTGAWVIVDSDHISGTNDWQRLQVTFKLPSDALTGEVYVNAGIEEETGTAYFDAMQLENGSIANRYNLVENANFTYGTETPTFWGKDEGCNSGDDIVTSDDSTYPAILDYQKKVFKINGSSTVEGSQFNY
ncbi:DNRLRE domain-containing protein [Clostridium grantii]|uniref:YD repeat-containing protein n=1 Tax=Clostridium grantii DSM 8605 TaxID=1121316 RepID=A0A1M5XVX9_9CLOT|nr:DNRLRE domain-containing protein [Clostridium grantii]SHI03413.1 YD repeat-containing protein [Clostridium grantii DSM 8605]